MRTYLSIFFLIIGFARADMNLHSFEMEDIEGNQVRLEQFKGQVVLIVNTASRCGLTPQYAELVELMNQYEGKPFVILGFPANNFMNQEPGTNAEIAQFCEDRFGVNFPMFSRISVRGRDMDPLFAFLTQAPNPDFTGDVGWNFEKFLVGPDGTLQRRFRSRVRPSDARVTEAINALLPAP